MINNTKATLGNARNWLPNQSASPASVTFAAEGFAFEIAGLALSKKVISHSLGVGGTAKERTLSEARI